MRDGNLYSDMRPWSAPEGYGVDISKPAEGFFRGKLCSRGIPGGIKIIYGPPLDPITGEELDRSWRWYALFDGEYVEIDEVWPECAGDPISAEEYRVLVNRRAWARQAMPDSAFANPKRRYDPLSASEVLPF